VLVPVISTRMISFPLFVQRSVHRLMQAEYTPSKFRRASVFLQIKSALSISGAVVIGPVTCVVDVNDLEEFDA
jgi:hypothetical protein